jgi:beta-lactamase regulating signal transducer with metallopeptidase domain
LILYWIIWRTIMTEVINLFAQKWWDWMSVMFLQVSLLIFLIWIIDLMLRKWVWPQVRYVLWLMVFVKLILPPTFSTSTSLTSRIFPSVKFIFQTKEYANEPVSTSGTLEQSVINTKNKNELKQLVGRPTLLKHGRTSSSKLKWQVYAMAIWFLGVVLFSMRVIIKLKHLDTLFKNKHIPTMPVYFQPLLFRCANRLKLKRIPAVILTGKVNNPAIFGLFKPRLLIPKNYLKKQSRNNIKHILLHELAHFKRGDLLVHTIQCMLQIIYWFNPLLWFVRKNVRNLREICCDSTVAQLLQKNTSSYRQTLVESAQQLLAQNVEPGLGLLGLFEDPNSLVVRLKWLKKNSWQHRKLKLLTTWFAFVFLFFTND